MNDQVTRPISDSELPDSMAGGAEGSSLLVDSAISHCEKLMRVMKLEEWISGPRANRILAAAFRGGQERAAGWFPGLTLNGGRADWPRPAGSTGRTAHWPPP